VFLNSHREKHPKTRKNPKKSRKNRYRNFCRLFRICFWHGLFTKIFWWCFLTPLTEKRPKNLPKKKTRNRYLVLVGSSEFNQIYVKARRFFLRFEGPLPGGGRGLEPLELGQGASKKKEKENKGQKNNPKKQPTDFPLFFSFFFRCPLRRPWAVCGHTTACGHPQLAVGSSFTS
jgi:hypothetical protein